jgi:hypothetical protein
MYYDAPETLTFTNYTPYQHNPAHPLLATNLAGYMSWGAHSLLGNSYATNGYMHWSGDSRWWIIETVESYNGQRENAVQGHVLQWFSPNAFGGLNYSNTPVGAVSHVDEPGVLNISDSGLYFGLWALGKNFGIAAWRSRKTPYFQAVGDPLIVR